MNFKTLPATYFANFPVEWVLLEAIPFGSCFVRSNQGVDNHTTEEAIFQLSDPGYEYREI